MKRSLLIYFLVLEIMLSKAQGPSSNPGTLPSIIPPSPEVASLNMVGSMSTSLHTGAANAAIPLYDLSVGSLKLPINLNYSTNGTHTNDISSRVGLGWNLIAGGCISRVIHDEEDGGTGVTTLAPPDFGQQNQSLMNYLFYANLENYDTEADEFTFSVNGMSGKFFIDGNGVVQLSDHSDLKITKDATGFTLTTGEGIVYEFGKNLELEKTRDVKTNGNARANKVKTTAWFLTRIISTRGDIIQFHYNPIYIKSHLGPYQSVILRTLDPMYPSGEPFASFPTDCKPKCGGQFSSPGFNRVDYDSYYLDHISTSNGQHVYFVYADRPDGSGDNRLTDIIVSSTNSESTARTIKKYQLEYDDSYAISGDLNQRFFLKRLFTRSTGNESPSLVLEHEFEYYDPSTLASQESLLQDYYGYSKGNGTQPANFFPKPLNYTAYENGNQGADRSPNFSATRAGALKKIFYPTGGYSEFEYEPHTLIDYVTDSVFTSSANLYGVGVGYSTITSTPYVYSFNVNSAPVRIEYVTEWNPSGPTPGSPQYWTPDDIHFLSYLELWDVTNNQRIFEWRHKNYLGSNYYPHLNPGIQYELRLKVAGNSHAAYVNLKYNPVVQQTSVNMPACGIRVKQINNYDPVSGTTNKKIYKYTSLTNNITGITSGIGTMRPSFEASYQGGGVCFDMENPPTVMGEKLAICPGGLLQVSSSSLSGSFTFSGSPVAYTHVIEANDISLINGGIEHKFYTYHNPQTQLTVIGSQIAGASAAGSFPDMNGIELKTTWFKRSANTFIALKTEENNFSYDPRVNSTLINYQVRKRWDPPTESQWSYQDKLLGYDVGSYLFIKSWLHLDNKIVTEFDENGLNPHQQSITYTYDNIFHTRPTSTTTSNSRNEVVKEELRYPHDFNSAVTNSMIANHIITPVLQQKNTVNNQLISTTETQYSNWSNTGSLYQPETVKVAKGNNSLEPRLQYYYYDQAGNPLELSKTDDHHIVYLWNYLKTYPVAEVKNATLNDVAYTSFEGDADGGWNFDPTNIVGDAITGKNAFSGGLSKIVSSSQNYVVTLWAKSGATVNNSTGTLLKSINGWSLYKWFVSNQSKIDIAGSHIDEVRLYPIKAEMKTFTYTPFVGISDENDVNNNIKYYTYDGLNRLVVIRDKDQNIIAQYDYKYKQVIATCQNTTPNWQSTSRTQCVVGSNNNYTGEQMMEERDLNNCSSTYLQTRLVSMGITGNCTPLPGCTGPSQRVVNGTCETGTKVLVSSSNTGGNNWQCMYKYVWSDGYEGHSFIESSSSPCVMADL